QHVLHLPHSRANLNLRFPWRCFIFFITIRGAISYRFILLNPPPTIYLPDAYGTIGGGKR
ncbi:unnamed protein product, partial [Brassica oleracea]